MSIILAMISLCSSCARFISGDIKIPVAPRDTTSIEMARMALLMPRITFDDQQQGNLVVFSYLFDGTLNDRNRIPKGERETIISYISSRIPGSNYFPGVGMQDRNKSFLDAISGRSMISTAEHAKKNLFEQIDKTIALHPKTEFRIFVSGFSRGAATARHFMNILDKEWRNRFTPKKHGDPPRIRIYALLYDSVSTGGDKQLLLSLPESVNYSMHFVATDESRKLFPVDIDIPTPEDIKTGIHPSRINTLFLPGAHSDVGASYAKGIGDAYRLLTDYSLSMLGLIKDTCFQSDSDPMINGKHDSRGLLEKILGVSPPNSQNPNQRRTKNINPRNLNNLQRSEINQSIARLSEPNFNRWTVTTTHRLDPFYFVAHREPGKISLTDISKNIDPSSARLELLNNGDASFYFRHHQSTMTGKIVLPSSVINHIKNHDTKIETTYLSITNGLQLNFFADGVFVDAIHANKIQTTAEHEKSNCPPLPQMLIIHSKD